MTTLEDGRALAAPAPAVPVLGLAVELAAVAPVAVPTVPAPGGAPAAERDPERLADDHESLAAVLAARGEWRGAYEHLRAAVALRAGADPPRAGDVTGHVRGEVEQLLRSHAEAWEQSRRDALTATYNRRYLDERLTDLLAGPTRVAGCGLAVALVDLDWFKRVNDTHGHLVGDRVLQQVVEVLQDGLPDGAFCARYGGEEFVLVLPHVEGPDAVALCEAARSRVERHPWERIAPGLRVTVSAGVAHRELDDAPGAASPAGRDEQLRGVQEMLLRADQLLYTAKQAGRNAVAHRTPDGVALAGPAGARRGAP